jgi:hypothetical protein
MNILNSINHIKSINIVNGFTPFTFDICGTNFIGSPNNYPIQLNNGSTTVTNLTYTRLTNINSITLASIPVTLYIKAKFQNANHATNPAAGSYPDTIFRTYGTGGRGITLRGTVNQNNVYLGLFDGSVVRELTVSNLLVNPTDYFHTFIVFTNSTTTFFFYRDTGVLYTNSSQYSTTINNSGGVFFTRNVSQGYGTLDYTSAYNVIIGLGGWYNRSLTTSEMSKVVLQYPK